MKIRFFIELAEVYSYMTAFDEFFWLGTLFLIGFREHQYTFYGLLQVWRGEVHLTVFIVDWYPASIHKNTV